MKNCCQFKKQQLLQDVTSKQENQEIDAVGPQNSIGGRP
jgi:hypothetical protein